MTRNRILLLLAAALLCLAFVACGGDDDVDDLEPDIEDGPAEDVRGLWTGTYASAEGGTQAGTFCMNLDQDGRQVQGEIAFDGGEPIDIAGLIVEQRMNLVWGSEGFGGTPAPTVEGTDAAVATATGVSFDRGGSLSGEALGGGASGAYQTLSADRGDWTASIADGGQCG